MTPTSVSAAPDPARAWWKPDAPVAAPTFSPVDGAGAPGSPVAFGALVGFTMVLLLAPQTLVPILGAMRPAFTAAMIAVIAHVGQRLSAGEPIARPTRETWLAGAIFAWAVVTLPASMWPGGSVALMLDLFTKSLLVFWLLPNIVDTPWRLRRFVTVLALLSAPLAITAMHNYRAGLFIAGGGGAITRIAGYDAPLTQNPNDLALMLNLLLPLAVALLLCRPRPALRLVLLATIALDAAGIVLTFSRAGFLALAVVTLAWLWKLRHRREGRAAFLLLIVLAVACLPFLPAGYTDRLATVTDTRADATGSAQERWSDTVSALRYVSKNPIVGAGIGQDVLALNEERGARWRQVHNVYLQYAVDLGLPGALLFVALLWGCLAGVFRVERAAERRGATEMAHLASGIRISLLAFLVAGLFHPVGYHFYVFYVAGLALSLRAAWTRLVPAGAGAAA